MGRLSELRHREAAAAEVTSTLRAVLGGLWNPSMTNLQDLSMGRLDQALDKLRNGRSFFLSAAVFSIWREIFGSVPAIFTAPTFTRRQSPPCQTRRAHPVPMIPPNPGRSSAVNAAVLSSARTNMVSTTCSAIAAKGRFARPATLSDSAVSKHPATRFMLRIRWFFGSFLLFRSSEPKANDKVVAANKAERGRVGTPLALLKLQSAQL